MRPTTRILLIVPGKEILEASAYFAGRVDDFVCSPIDRAELQVRVNELMSRPPRGAASRRVGRVELDVAAHAIRIDGEILDLSPAELRLMIFFLQNTDRAYSRTQLLHQAWGNSHITERAVDVTVRRLRSVLQNYGCAEMIQTVRGIGYRFGAV